MIIVYHFLNQFITENFYIGKELLIKKEEFLLIQIE